MRVHWLQHAAHESLGSIELWLRARGHAVSCTRLFAGEALPDPAGLDWLLVLGGPMNVYEYRKHPWLRPEKRFLDQAIIRNKRVLGICLGAQLIADVLGARVIRNKYTEIGFYPVNSLREASSYGLLDAVPDGAEVFHWHGDTYELPPGATRHHKNDACVNQSFSWGPRVLGLQFHLEVQLPDARRWLALARPRPARYVQAADVILARPQRFDANNRMMDALLERMAGADR